VIRNIRREEGVGLPITMGVLLIVMMLAAWALSSTQIQSVSSQTDLNGKRAIAAADAGLQAASWRLVRSTPSAITGTQCVRTDVPAVGPVETDCAAAPDRVSLGNGVEYAFVVTREYTTTDVANNVHCAGERVVAFDRCATAVGYVNGVARRRVQTRLAPTTFRHAGLIADESVSLQNNDQTFVCAGESPGVVGSNDIITLGNNNKLADSGTCGGSGTWSVQTEEPGKVSGTTVEGVTRVPIPYPGRYDFPPIDFGTTATGNDNATITGAGISWNGGFARRELWLGAGTVELRAGTYNFCNLIVLQGSVLTVRAGEVAKVYIDSPDRPGSGCALGTGGFYLQSNTATNWGNPSDPVTSASPATRAPQLQIYVYGSTAWESPNTKPCNGEKGGAVLICNGSSLAAAIYAPNSQVVLSNQADFVGAIAADKIVLENGVKFRLPNGLDLGSNRDAKMMRWTECTKAAPNPSNYESGCAAGALDTP
jgi:hypothetical protein